MIRRVVAIVAVLIAAWCVHAVAPEATCGPIRISEVCWGGRPEDPSAEWIELANTADGPVDLDGWRLVSSDGSPDIALSGRILPADPASPTRGYFLLERNSDDAVPDVTADLIYSGALNDRGEILFLYDSEQNLVDTANALPDSPEAPPWAAGTNVYGVPPCRSMERIAPCLEDAPTAWATCPPIEEDATLGGPGTPRRQNRASNLPPEAFFLVDPPSPAPGRAARFDATGSSDESGWIDRYVWDFGDGTAETGTAVTSHTYVLPGRYEASLVVVDDQGAVAHARQWIDVALSRPPVADFSVRSLSGRRELFTLDRLRFQDESSDEETEVAAWSWSFGDGASASAQHPEHAYVRPGRYTVSLTVEDEQGDQSVQTQSLRIANRPPAAAFSFGSSSPSQGEAILLDASASMDADGSIVSYAWDFEADGSTDLVSPEPIAALPWDRGGEVSIALVVTDDTGDRSLPFARTIDVNHAPTAQFSTSATAVDDGETVAFLDCSYDPDGKIEAWRWEFGDGHSESAVSPAHVFEEAGTYTVTLSVTDDDGASHATARPISVRNAPPRATVSAPVAEGDTGYTFTLDAGASVDPSPHGRIVRYEWDYDGDGTYDESTSSAVVRRAYEEDGSFTVRVRVVDDDGAAAVSAPVLLTVCNRPPTVTAPRWSPRPATDGDEVAFEATASDPDGEVVAWEWTFGDGATSGEIRARHRFPDDGCFFVSVRVIDNDGAISEAVSFPIDIANAAPEAAWETLGVDGCALGVAFDATASYDPSPTGAIVHVAWDFGDGTSCPGGENTCGSADRWRPVHCYAAPGSYTITLILLDEEGAIARLTRQIVILN